MVLQSLIGLPAFLVYFCTDLVTMVLYLRATAHDEFTRIRKDCTPASIALSLLGFVLPVAGAIDAQRDPYGEEGFVRQMLMPLPNFPTATW